MENTNQPTLFSPISTSPPPVLFSSVSHPFPPQFQSTSFNGIVPTNSWINNLFYKNAAGTFTEPYNTKNLDTNSYFGLSVGQTQIAQKTLGTNITGVDCQYYSNDLGTDLRISSAEFHRSAPSRLITSWDHFSATLQLKLPSGNITFPLVRGMAYVTAIYSDLVPVIVSPKIIRTINGVEGNKGYSATGSRFIISFNDSPQSTYTIYTLNEPITLILADATTLVATKTYNGVIRVAKVPSAFDAQQILDDRSKVYPTGGSLLASVNGTSGSYSITWMIQNDDGKGVLMYAPPHIQHSMDLSSSQQTDLSLDSGTHGPMKAYIGNNWNITEVQLSQASWLPLKPAIATTDKDLVISALESEIRVDWDVDTNLELNYFSGKSLQKWALVTLIANDPSTGIANTSHGATALSKLKNAFSRFLDNKQKNPLCYDKTYKGVIARGGLPKKDGGTGDHLNEFGATYYNDHHFHYGYYLTTAAVIHQLDPKWRTADITQWAETLIRDVNNPSLKDPYFPVFRYFDWFLGHTWAAGIDIPGRCDGRDEESHSEAINFFWGVKLWGLAAKNQKLVDLASLQLAVYNRAASEYFLLLDGNQNHPPSFVAHKTSGIHFEAKCDYTTYFGQNTEYIHGIQMLPATPALSELRSVEFITQEWESKLTNIVQYISSGWAGILYTNYALIAPHSAFTALQTVKLDDGLSRTWALYWASTCKNGSIAK